MKRIDEKGNKIFVSKAVKQIFNRWEHGKMFHGYDLAEDCITEYPELKNVYTDTFLRFLRKFFNEKYILVKKSESLYKKL